MGGALSILRTTLFLTRTFVLVQPAKQSLASACYKTRSGQEILLLPWKYGLFKIVIVNVLNLERSCY